MGEKETEISVTKPTGETITYPYRDIDYIDFFMKDGSERRVKTSELRSMHVQLKPGVEVKG